MCQAPPSGCAATEIANDHGRCANTKNIAASVSLSVCGRRRGNGAFEEHRGTEKCDRQRGVFSGTLSRRAGDARRADH